jgi:hypothetical protein
MLLVNYFYDLSEQGDYTSDPDEGCLVKLCKPCARKAGDAVDWASKGDEDSRCEMCSAEQEDR